MDQQAAFIESFVAPHRRDRYRHLGGVPNEKLAHDLEHDLDPRFVVEVPGPARVAVGAILEALTTQRQCHCISRWFEQCDAVPIADAVDAPDDTLCLVEPGRLAYYIPERATGDGLTYLLLRREIDRRDAREALAQEAAARKPRRRRRR